MSEEVKDIYYLKDQDGDILSKIEIKSADSHAVIGDCYLVSTWASNNIPIEYEYVTGFYCKWDSCTHWNFYGEDYYPESESDEFDSYYHLCGANDFTWHIRNMCFVWKLCAQLMIEANKKRTDYDNSACIEYDYHKTETIRQLIELMLKDYTIVKEDV
jgi:hypothetical protein